jgi:hypothetical protein
MVEVKPASVGRAQGIHQRLGKTQGLPQLVLELWGTRAATSSVSNEMKGRCNDQGQEISGEKGPFDVS